MFETLETRQFLSATQITDGTSNTLTYATATAEAPAQTVYVGKAGGDQQAYMEWKLKEVLISGWSGA